MADLLILAAAVAVLTTVLAVMAALADHGPSLLARMRGWRR